jgi:phosphoribosyl 1,2-cyclic phosphodiesterase
MRFSVLASGSSGNAALLEVNGFGLLIDAGLGPRQLASRLAAVGSSWKQVRAALITHTHSDHWKDSTLAQLRRLETVLHCHPEHRTQLRTYSPEFIRLEEAKLVQCYDPESELELGPLTCRPLEVHHDCGPTFGFRLHGPPDIFGARCALGYLTDLGRWTDKQAEALANVDVLALEFNHDVEMERNSGRPRELVDRVLGDLGHLSNEQAAALTRAVLKRSAAGALRHLVQLHLSRHCNKPKLAQAAARCVLDEHSPATALHTASQHRHGPVLKLV